jgi:flagellar hook-associated protein 3 FlgL
MASIRVTQQILINRALNNLSDQSRRIMNLQEQLATGLAVNRPSDNPLAMRRAINARAEITKNEQYLTNITSISPYQSETESTIMTVVNIVHRANELVLQGASDTNAQTQRDQIAIEINQLLESALNQSNHITNGRYIFGGTRTLNPPFVATRDANGEITAVAYEGNNERISVEVSDGVRIPYNETGVDVFLQTIPETTDLFQTLIDLRDNLRAGNTNALTNQMTELDKALDQLIIATTRVGAIENRFQQIDANLRDISQQLELVYSDSIDADFAEVIIQLNAQSNAFQAALTAAARVIQPSLLDYI